MTTRDEYYEGPGRAPDVILVNPAMINLYREALGAPPLTQEEIDALPKHPCGWIILSGIR